MTMHAPSWSPSMMAVFGAWLRFSFWVRFEEVCLSRKAVLPVGKTVVVVSNHMSWWDGFLIYLYRCRVSPNAPIFSVMLEEQLEKHGWLRKIGCVGIQPGNLKTTRETFCEIAQACADQPGSWILFFPQGRIVPSWRRPLGSRRGIELLLNELDDAVILPIGLHIEPLTTSKPTAFLLAGQTVSMSRGVKTDAGSGKRITAGDIESMITNQLDRLMDHIRKHEEDSGRKWTEIDRDLDVDRSLQFAEEDDTISLSDD